MVLIIKSFTMEAMEFVTNFEITLEEIRDLIKPELKLVIDQLKKIDPLDLVTTETYQMTENDVRIYVWRMYLQRAMNDFPNSFPKPSYNSILI